MPTIKKINVGGVSYDIGGLTEDVKQASLQIAEKAAYIDEHGQDYYDDLYDAFYDNTWNVTNTLSNASTSNSATKTAKDGTYTAIISANTGYTLDGATVQVTMGGANVTSAVYSNGTISIPSVTGDVVITVVAVALTVVSISAVYTQSGTVYDTDTLDSLKNDLIVTATMSDSSTIVVPGDEYTLSGALTEGTSTITVGYSGMTVIFTVNVVAAPVIITSSSPNVSFGSFDITKSPTYKANTTKNRIAALGENLLGYPCEYGATYHFAVSGVAYTTMEISVNILNTSAKSAVESGVNGVDADINRPGWMATANGFDITPPQSINGNPPAIMWLAIRRDSSNSMFDNLSDIGTITITKTTA